MGGSLRHYNLISRLDKLDWIDDHIWVALVILEILLIRIAVWPELLILFLLLVLLLLL